MIFSKVLVLVATCAVVGIHAEDSAPKGKDLHDSRVVLDTDAALPIDVEDRGIDLEGLHGGKSGTKKASVQADVNEIFIKQKRFNKDKKHEWFRRRGCDWDRDCCDDDCDWDCCDDRFGCGGCDGGFGGWGGWGCNNFGGFGVGGVLPGNFGGFGPVVGGLGIDGIAGGPFNGVGFPGGPYGGL